jgi:signal transduction histidine kinase
MTHRPPASSEELRQAFADYERPVAIQNYRVGCILGIIFMPAGATLDYFVYPDKVNLFLAFRLVCSGLLALVWLALGTKPGARLYRALGMIEVFLPLFFISGMIYATDGAASPYYAGLNLVVMGAGLVLRWTLVESVSVVLMALGLYLAACLAHGGQQAFKDFFNNCYFLIVTGVFTVVGNYFYGRIRFREFSLRFQLDKSHQMLEARNRQLRELDEIKSRFFANVSHELRTPLTLLLAPLESLLTGRPDLDPETRDWLETMRANGLRLLKLINDLLDLVRLESGRMQVAQETIHLPDFIRGLGQALKQFAMDKRVVFEVRVAEHIDRVLTDAGKLEKILLNLLFNALKFTPAGGRVQLEAEQAGADLVFHVRDTGMGIAEDQLPFIFDRFWQADTSSQRKNQGVGIGLALVKELAETLGGRVDVESQLGIGTHFRVRLPLISDTPQPSQLELEVETPASSESAAAEVSAVQHDHWLTRLYRRAELFPSIASLQESVKPVETTGAANIPRVLIADDEPDMLRFLRSQLATRFQVLEAVDGHQAVEKATQFLPDLVLCDMMMPEMDGLEVCRELRRRTPTQSIPIVLLTARADEPTKIKSLEAGASDFLTKPFSCAELHVRLRNLIEAYHFQRELARQKCTLEAALEQLKETESQLVQAEKMASLGRLSAGIIHEVNNPLNFIKSGLYALRKKGDALPAEQRASFEEVLVDLEDGVNRVRNIVSDLRGFAHPSTSRNDEVATESLITTALRLLSHEWKGQVDIVQDIPPHHALRGNRSQLVQVLVNLLQNALDATQRKHYADGQPTIWISATQANGRSQVRIRDNGLGIKAEDLSKIFEPFFTTKDVGQGMGLGLSICYRIIAEHEGRIQVASEPGQFCEFALDLPAPLT